jgi:hypothetical protein
MSAQATPEPRPAPRRPLLEIVLDPRNIQWLLLFGAAMLVLGLVIYLYTLGVFEDARMVAVLMGVSTLGLLVSGGATVHWTRYQLAGRALTLLACLIMPLNLWFYHAQGLHPFTLYERLWVAALVCCALYAASAWVLRDPLFAYVLIAGVTMTGLLILADVDGAGEFWQITHPATLLVVLGLIAIHAERAFPEAPAGPFTRKRFGLAFFWSGHAVMADGLLLLLGAQLTAYAFALNEPLFHNWHLNQPSPITTDQPLKILALCLVLAGMYAYLYSELVVRRIGLYLYLAVFTLLWAELLVIDLLALQITQERAILVMALTALAANLAQPILARRRVDDRGDASTGSQSVLGTAPAKSVQPIGLFLSALPVLLGVWLQWRARNHTYEIGWAYVGAMLVTAISCRIGAHLYRYAFPNLSAIYFFGTAAATIAGAAGLLTVMGFGTWEQQAPALMIIPILYLVAAWLYRGQTAERPLVWVSHAATVVLLLSSLVAAFRAFLMVRGEPLNLAMAEVFAEAALFYGLAAAFRRRAINIYLCTAMACGAVWQLLSYGNLDDLYYTLTFAIVGLLLLIAYRFAVLEQLKVKGLADAAFVCANSLLSLGFLAGALLTLSQLAASHRQAKGALVGMLLTLFVISLLAVVLVRQEGWRRWYVVTSVTEAVLTALVLAVFGNLTLGEKLEIASVVIGLGLLVVGHIGWFREQDRQSELVSFCLLLGSVLVAMPLTTAVVYYRSTKDLPHWPDEIGMLAAGILLLATGFMFQLRSTTLAGGVLVTAYIVTLPIYLPWKQLGLPAVFLMVGGGAVFGTGLLLSVYRDRLLALPDKIKRREGFFRVLGWR